MRTTIELPDELLTRAKTSAVQRGISLKQFFVEAVEQKLAEPKKVRREPPIVGDGTGPRIGILTPEQVADAAFGPIDAYLPGRR